MRVLAVGLSEDFVKDVEKSFDKDFFCIIDTAEDTYDATNFTDFRYYELVIINQAEITLSFKRFLSEVRRKNKETKIIILNEDEKMQIEFFKFGVSDVVYSHVNSPRLLAVRIQSNMRELFEKRISIKSLTIDIPAKEVTGNSKHISLNGKTFDILAYLALRKHRVFSKDEIINALWDEPEYVSDNTVEVAINQIRKRLKSAVGSQVIHTVRRRGYKFSY